METHIKGTNTALRMSQELETALRQELKERNGKEANKETNDSQDKKEE